jgi:hypothetical protein
MIRSCAYSAPLKVNLLLHRKMLEDHWFARKFAAKTFALDVFFVRIVKAMQGNSWCTKNNIGGPG